MKAKLAYIALFVICWLGSTPAITFGQNKDDCDTANVSPSALVCAFRVSPLSLVPLTAGQLYKSPTDLSLVPYETHLYPNQSNVMPAAHRASGEAIAASIQPLDATGKVDLTNGKIAAIVEGMSNTFHETNAFIQYFLQNNPAVNPKFKLANLAIRGCPLTCWVPKGVGAVDPQVQIVIMKHSNNMPQEANGAPRFPEPPFLTADDKRFPSHALETRKMLKTRILDLKKKYPNLKLLFITSRSYGGWTCAPAAIGYGEPVAFEEGFSTKWLLEDQILGTDPDLAFSGPNAKAPWMAWGPYIWDPAWTQDMFNDGVHPCLTGQLAVAQKWYDLFMQDVLARPWFRDNAAPTAPANLTAVTVNPNLINLVWNNSTDNSGSVKYKIFRDGVLVAMTSAATYADAAVQPAVPYCYTISAVDSAGNESAQSNRACATISISGVADNSPRSLAYKLFQNHPNPLGPETEIGFQLPKAGEVLVKIYNIFGAEIRTLTETKYAAGTHSVRWDGTDERGNPAANGVYLYQLRAGNFSQVKRMTLLR